jgi:hypothetical protein
MERLELPKRRGLGRKILVGLIVGLLAIVLAAAGAIYRSPRAPART